MEDLSIRPGFNLHAAFRGHLSSVRRITYNARTKQFLSMDEHCLKAWTVHLDGTTRVQYDVQFPGYQQNFITSMVLSQELNLLFTACLDDNLRLYNERLRLKSCMPWSNGVVREMAFYEPRSLLITAGSYGVKVWECLLDYEAFRTDKTSDLYDVPKIKDGSVLPWCFGKYQHVRLRCTLHVPGARLMGGGGGNGGGLGAAAAGGGGGSPRGPPQQRDAATTTTTTSGSVVDSDMALASGLGGGEAEHIDAPWCDRIVLHEPTAMVLAMFQGHVYGFDIMSGTCLSSYTGLYTQPVTSCVFVPESDLLYTTAMDTCAVLWRIPRGCEAQRFKQFGRTYAPMTVVTQDPDMKHVLTTSLDGSVTLWDMDTLVPVFKMKLSRAPVSTAFYKPNAFFLATDTEVKIFTITHLFEAWMDCNSPVVSLRPVSYGLIQAEFADSSVRLLDAHDSSRPDKSVLVTMPQLSSQQLVASVVALPAARLFVLLADGAIHVWQLHLRRPPSFLAAWTHLSRESGVSLSYIDGGVLSPAVSGRMSLPYDHVTGFTHDHLAIGTASGDCVLVDITSGHISFRFPAYKHQPLQILAPDLDRGVLVTVSRTTIKIWTLHDMRCLHELCTSRPVTRLKLLEGRAVVGTVSGSVHVMELSSGASNAASVTVDHLDAITGIGQSVFLQHFVTGSKDSHIKIFDRDKRFKRSIYLGAPVSAVSYLNDRGDILVAMGTRLVVIRVDKYDKLPSAPKDSIYDDLRGQGRAPRTLLRAMQSRLQRLSRCKVPLQAYAAWVANGGGETDGSGGAAARGGSAGAVMRRRTPPMRRLRSFIMNESADRAAPLQGGVGRSGNAASGGGSGSGGRGSFARPGSQAGGGGSGGGVSSSGRRPLSRDAVTPAAPVAAAAAALASRPSSVLKGVLKMMTTSGGPAGDGDAQDLRPGSRGGNRSVQWQTAANGGLTPRSDAGSTTVATTVATTAAVTMAAASVVPQSPRGGGPVDKAMTMRTTSRQDCTADAASGGNGGGGSDGAGDGEVTQSEDEDEGRLIAREIYPLKFKYNLHRERMRIDRLLHGLPSIHQRVNRALQTATEPERPRTGSRTPSRESERPGPSADANSTGPQPPQQPQQQQQQQQRQQSGQAHGPSGAVQGGLVLGGASSLLLRLTTLQGGGGGPEGGSDRLEEGSIADGSQEDSSDEDDGHSSESGSASISSGSDTSEVPLAAAAAAAAAAGLSARFRRTLPVIASPSAFFDGHIPPEVLLPSSGKKSGAQQQHAKAKRASNDSAAATAAATSERTSGDGLGGGGGGGGGEACEAGTTGAGPGSVQRGKDLGRERYLDQRFWKEDGAGQIGEGEAKKRKKRKKKKKKRRRGAPGDKDLVEELKARLDYEIRAEVKAFEKHQTVQRLARATFLPRLGGPTTAAVAAASRAILTAPVMPGSRCGTEPGGAANAAAAAAAAGTGSAAATASGTSAGDAVASGGGGCRSDSGAAAPPQPVSLSHQISCGPSFKALFKSLGVRGGVNDMARIMKDPSRFVVAQDQGPGGGSGGDGGGGGKITQLQPHSDGEGAATGSQPQPRAFSGAVVGRGGYGYKAFMDAYRQ